MAILVVAGLALSCSNGCFVDADDVWCREISDNELHVSGVEEIVFGSGSSVEIINALCLNYSDSTLLCELTFSTSIKGRWVVYNPQNETCVGVKTKCWENKTKRA